MRVLALEHEIDGATPQQFAAKARDEAARVWQLYQQGVIRESFFRQDRKAAVLLLECADVDEAREALASLPYVEAGLIRFELIPLVPYPGFERLFEGGTP